MSGGTYNGEQSYILSIIDKIEEEMESMGKMIPQEEINYSPKYYNDYPEMKYNHTYAKDIISEFEKGIKLMQKAYIYAQRIDYLLAGDDSEDSFRERLKEELEEFKNTEAQIKETQCY